MNIYQLMMSLERLLAIAGDGKRKPRVQALRPEPGEEVICKSERSADIIKIPMSSITSELGRCYNK